MIIGVGLDARFGLPFGRLREVGREAERLGFENLRTRPAKCHPPSRCTWQHSVRRCGCCPAGLLPRHRLVLGPWSGDFSLTNAGIGHPCRCWRGGCPRSTSRRRSSGWCREPCHRRNTPSDRPGTTCRDAARTVITFGLLAHLLTQRWGSPAAHRRPGARLGAARRRGRQVRAGCRPVAAGPSRACRDVRSFGRLPAHTSPGHR